jgi:hypothetical protein
MISTGDCVIIRGRRYEVFSNRNGVLYSLREDGRYRPLSHYQRSNMEPIQVDHVDDDDDAMDLS